MRPPPKIGPRSPVTYPAYINHTFLEQEEGFRLLGEVGGEGGDAIRKMELGNRGVGKTPEKPLPSLVAGAAGPWSMTLQ